MSTKAIYDRLRTPLLRRIAGAAWWSVLGGASYRVAQLVSAILVARELGPEPFGALGVLNSTLQVFQSAAVLGLGVTAERYVAHYRRSQPDLASRVLGMSLVTVVVSTTALVAVLLVSSSWVAGTALARVDLTWALRMSALALAGAAVQQAACGTLRGVERFDYIAQIQMAFACVTVPVLYVAAKSSGLSGVVVSMAALALMQAGITLGVSRRALNAVHLRYNVREWRREVSVLGRFSLPAVLAGLLMAPAIWGSQAFVAHIPGGYAELGVYAAASQWFTAVLFFPTMTSGVLLPVLAERVSLEDWPGVSKLLFGAAVCNALVTVPVGLAVLVFQDDVMRLNGGAFVGRGDVVALSVVAAALVAVQLPIGQLIAAAGRMWLGFAMNAFWGGVLLASTWHLRELGATGLASARVIAYAAHLFSTVCVAWWVLGHGRRATCGVSTGL